MAKVKKVLILYITERSGHHSAALAIKKALELSDPDCSCFCLNIFQYTFPLLERIIHNIYLAVIKRVPKIWERMYDNPKLVGRSEKIKSWIHSLSLKKFSALMDSFKPDAVVCTQAFPCGIAADYKRIQRSSVPLIAVLTDFAPHSFWIYDNVDHYIVPCEESSDLLIAKGVTKDKIKIFGIPIDPKFAKSLDRQELFANYGLKADVPVIMIMGGGHGLGPIKDVLYELDVADRDLQLITVCGLNEKLYHWINRTRFKNRVLNFKFTDQIERLMSLAALIITKPGGITTAEALAKNLPMIILNPIPGQEARNTQLLTKLGAALEVDNPSQLWPKVREILEKAKGKSWFSGENKALVQLSKPRSSLDIAHFILNL